MCVIKAEPQMRSLHAEGHQSVLSLCMNQRCWPREQSQRACPGSKASGLCRQYAVVGALPLGAGGPFSAFCLPCPCVSFPPPQGDRQASRAQVTSWVASSSSIPLHTISTDSNWSPLPASAPLLPAQGPGLGSGAGVLAAGCWLRVSPQTASSCFISRLLK